MNPNDPGSHSVQSSLRLRKNVMGLAIITCIFLTIGADCPPSTSTDTGPTVRYLDEQALLPNGTPTDDYVFAAGSDKRIRIEITPRGNTITDDVSVTYSFNHSTANAMSVGDAQEVRAIRLTGTATTQSIFAADIPARNLNRCGWFHYRWSFHYRPSSGGIPGFFATGTPKSFLVLHGVPGEPLHSTTPCDPVP